MDSRDERRAYLKGELKRRRVSFKAASGLIKRNETYIQQYVGGRSPDYLEDQDRAILVEKLGLDDSRLRPPPKEAGALPLSGRPGSQVDPPVVGNLSYETLDKEFLVVWGGLPPEFKAVGLTVLRAISSLVSEKIRKADDLTHSQP